MTYNSQLFLHHYDDVIMSAIASQIISFTIVYSTAYSDADHRKHQSAASLAFVREIYRWPVHSQHKWPITRKMFPFDDDIMCPKNVHPSAVSASTTDFYITTQGSFILQHIVNHPMRIVYIPTYSDLTSFIRHNLDAINTWAGIYLNR